MKYIHKNKTQFQAHTNFAKKETVITFTIILM